MQQRASDRHFSARMSGGKGQHGAGVQCTCKESRTRTLSGRPCCKAQSAMQSPRRASQTRSTTTALAVARSGKQNGSHASTTLSAYRAN